MGDGMLGLVLLSLNAVYALVPLIVILILIGAAAGLMRGKDLFKLFGIEVLFGIGGGIGGSTAGKGLKGKGAAYRSTIKIPPPVTKIRQSKFREEVSPSSVKSFFNGRQGKTPLNELITKNPQLLSEILDVGRVRMSVKDDLKDRERVLREWVLERHAARLGANPKNIQDWYQNLPKNSLERKAIDKEFEAIQRLSKVRMSVEQQEAALGGAVGILEKYATKSGANPDNIYDWFQEISPPPARTLKDYLLHEPQIQKPTYDPETYKAIVQELSDLHKNVMSQPPRNVYERMAQIQDKWGERIAGLYFVSQLPEMQRSPQTVAGPSGAVTSSFIEFAKARDAAKEKTRQVVAEEAAKRQEERTRQALEEAAKKQEGSS
jgi:hypothetical protein